MSEPAASSLHTGGPKKAQTRLWKDLKRYKAVYLLMLPALASLFVFSYLPMAGVVMAFNDYRLGKGFTAIFNSPWVGLAHFRRLFTTPYFYRVLGNTLAINGLKLVFVFPVPIMFAILVNELRSVRYKRLVQTVSYLPNFLSTVVVYGLVLSFLSPTFGLLNAAIYHLGGEPIYFIVQPEYFRGILVLLDIWRYTGWEAIIYLAAIVSIDQEQYESAVIDGANKFRRIWHITLPGIFNVILLMFIFRIGYLLSADFETVFLLYSPPVYSVGDIIDTFVYREGLIHSQFSYTTAVGLFKSVIGFLLIVVTARIAKKFGKSVVW